MNAAEPLPVASPSPKRAADPSSPLRRDALALAPTLALLALFYALSACPTVWWYDSAEFAARASSLTLAHAPGYPSYVLVAHLFTYLGPEPAWGTNLLSALFALASVAGAYTLQRQMGVRESFAAVIAFTLGVSPVLWANAVITEVYTAGLSFTLATTCLLAAGQPAERTRLIPLAAALAAFGLGMHMSLATCGLGFVLLALSAGMASESWTELARVFSTAQWRRRLRLARWCVLGLVVGLSVFLLFPLLELGEPHHRSWRGWWRLFSAKAFQPKFVASSATHEFPTRNFEALRMQLGWWGLGLGLVGALAALWRKPLFGLALPLAALGNLWFFWNYSVHDIEVFFLPAAAFTFVLAGFALETGAELLETRLERPPPAWWSSAFALLLLLLWPGSSLRETWASVDASEDRSARVYADLLIEEVPPNAIFVLYNHPEEWKHAAVLFYVQDALGERADIRVITRPNLDELDEQLAAGTPVYAFRDIRRVRRRVALEHQGGLERVRHTTREMRRK